MAVALVSLMVCSPLVHGSLRQPLLQFRSLCSSPFVRGPPVWPLLRSLMVDLPLSVHGSLGWPLLQFHSCRSPLSCDACLDGGCSIFAHGVFAPFMYGSLGRLLLLSCSCLLLSWFFYAEVAWVTVALVSPMGVHVCVATLCWACLSAHCPAHCCACTVHCSWLGSSKCCIARCPTHCSAHCYACLLIELIIGSMHCSDRCCAAHCCARLLICTARLLICTAHLLVALLVLGSCASYPLVAWLMRI